MDLPKFDPKAVVIEDQRGKTPSGVDNFQNNLRELGKLLNPVTAVRSVYNRVAAPEIKLKDNAFGRPRPAPLHKGMPPRG